MEKGPTSLIKCGRVAVPLWLGIGIRNSCFFST
jgi:hypothetical protein